MEKLQLIQLNNWVLNPNQKTLTKINENKLKPGTTKTLESKHALLLLCLIEHHGSIVSREKLVKIVWKNRFVDDRTINSTISRLRKLLGGNKQDFIKTHPKTGYSLVCSPKIITLDQESNYKQKSRYVISNKILVSIIIVSSLVLFNISFKYFNNASPASYQPKTKIKPLTYEEGWEFEPSLSSDGKLLAYVTFNSWNDKFKVHVLNNQSKITKTIDKDLVARSPVWFKDSYQLYYVANLKDECIIQKTTVNENLTFSPPETILSCGNSFYVPHLTLSQNGDWLYYLEQNEGFPSRIKRYNIATHETELLTNPPSNFRGDFDISINKAGTSVVFIRFYDDASHSILILDLLSGEQTDVTQKKYEVDSLGWTFSDKEFVFTDDALNTLFKVDTTDYEVTPIFKSNSRLSDPLFKDRKTAIVSLGDPYNSNIGSLTIKDGQSNFSHEVKSSFKDHSLVVKNNNDDYLFISNRSGSYELWMKKPNNLLQLTNFSNSANYLSEPIIFNNDSWSLFKLNRSYKLIDLNNLTIKGINFIKGEVRSFTRNCQNDKHLYVTSKINGQWQLIDLDIENSQSTIKASGVTLIKSNCKNRRYIATKKGSSGIFLFDADTMTMGKQIMSEYSFQNTENWALSDNHVFYWNHFDKQLIAYDFEKKNKLVLSLPDKNLIYLSAKKNKLFFSELSIENTYVGEITINGSQ